MAKPWAAQSMLERMVSAVERVRERLERATAALEEAAVPYAVVGGNAVAAWVTTIDPAAVRNTQDVDILLRRDDLDASERALSKVGFIRCESSGIEMFLDGPAGGPRDAIHILLAGEKVHANDEMPSPDVTQSEKPQSFRIIDMERLVQMKLTAFHRKDQVHLADMLELGLIDVTWTARFPMTLAKRLQLLIDTPEQ